MSVLKLLLKYLLYIELTDNRIYKGEVNRTYFTYCTEKFKLNDIIINYEIICANHGYYLRSGKTAVKTPAEKKT